MVLQISKTGAKLTEQNSVGLIYQYCASLPSDKFCDLRPIFKLTESSARYKCHLTLPNNAVVREAESPYSISDDKAKVAAAFQACKLLIEKGGLDDHLRPRNWKIQKAEASQNDKDGLAIGSRRQYKATGEVLQKSGPRKILLVLSQVNLSKWMYKHLLII
jgi:hypothetical protein